jgi:hypothetical protein
MSSDRTRIRVEVAGFALIAAVFGGGGGWATLRIGLTTVSEKVDRIDQRVAEMYCASLPPEKRPGCR